MNATPLAAALCLGAALSAAAPALAHHSFAQFDSKSVTMSGTVWAFEWTNPHTWLWVKFPDGKGGTTTWGLEGAAPGEMARNGGWSKHIVNRGDKITVSFRPLKDGRPGGSFGKVTLPDGRVIGGNGPPPAGGPPGAGGAQGAGGSPPPG